MEIKITKDAKKKIQEAMNSSKISNPALRLFFEGYGWGGPRIGMTLDELNKEKDTHLIDNEIDIVYDNSQKSVIENSPVMKIDYGKTLFGEGFFIDNGNNCWGKFINEMQKSSWEWINCSVPEVQFRFL